MGRVESSGMQAVVKFLPAVIFGAVILCAGMTLFLLRPDYFWFAEAGKCAKLKPASLRGLRRTTRDARDQISPPPKSGGFSATYGKNESDSERRKAREEDEVVFEDDKVVVEDLVKMWDILYGLANDVPPVEVERRQGWIEGQDYPIAPHLEDCERLTKEREASEMRGPGGKSHKWLHLQGVSKGVEPPWVKGSNKENLPMTRYMQALLWQHQHPRNCNDPNLKFAIIPWRKRIRSGLGSALHVMSVVFAATVPSGRILVPLSESFERAVHPGCTGSGYGSLNCYFFPFVSLECEKEAMDLWKQQKPADNISEPLDSRKKIIDLFLSDTRVVAIMDTRVLGKLKFQSFVPSDIGEPWADTTGSVEAFGNVTDHTERDVLRKAAWWHAQSMRYILRWPSRKTCHALNRIRQESYGKIVAQRIVRSIGLQKEALRLARDEDPQEAEILESIRVTSNSFESYSWATEEPYIPRPIVSIHIRQGDKMSEMRLFHFPSFMYLAERLRRHVPNLKTVWLSTEMQSVVDETDSYPTWDFLFTKNLRQEGNTSISSYEDPVGLDKFILLSFANLLIAGECDYFVGVLGSNWNRLINELRLTSGKLNAGIVALNNGQS